MRIKILFILFMLVAGIAGSQYFTIQFAINEMRLADINRTLAATREIPFFNKNLLSTSILRDSMLKTRRNIIMLGIILNMVWVLFVLLYIPFLSIQIVLIIFASYLVLAFIFSVIVYYITSIYYSDNDRFYIYTGFLPPTL